MTKEQNLVYRRLNRDFQTERFGIRIINGKRVGFYSKGDNLDALPVIHLFLFFFKCDIVIAASHPNSKMQQYLKELAEFCGDYAEILHEGELRQGEKIHRQIRNKLKSFL